MSKHALERVLCPACGTAMHRGVVRTVVTRIGRTAVSVPDVTVDECSRCGERLFDLTALEKIRKFRDARTKRRAA